MNTPHTNSIVYSITKASAVEVERAIDTVFKQHPITSHITEIVANLAYDDVNRNWTAQVSTSPKTN